MTTRKHLLAVDPSLTVSGWALFCLRSGSPRAVGLVTPPGPELLLARRLQSLQVSVTRLFETLELGRGDILVCEGPAPLVKNPQSAIKVEGVRGIFEAVARAQGIFVPGRINPRTVHTELLGMRGKQLPRQTVKDWARKAAFQLHAEALGQIEVESKKRSTKARSTVSQDIIDALLIGTVAVSKVRLAQRTGVDLEVALLSASEGGRLLRSRSREGRGVNWKEGDLRQLKIAK